MTGVEPNSKRKVILRKQENGETSIEMAVPISEIFSAVSSRSGIGGTPPNVITPPATTLPPTTARSSTTTTIRVLFAKLMGKQKVTK